MIVGAHAILYSTNGEADRAFLRDVLALPHVDVGGGWLIFGLPPSEVAVHPSDENDVHALYLMVDDVEAFIAQMRGHDIVCTPPENQGWGVLTSLTLPGGGKLGVYEPRHARPAAMVVAGGNDGARGAKRSAAAKKGSAKKGSAKKASAKKGSAKRGSAKQASAKQASAKKASAKKAPAKKAPAKKASAKKAPAKKGKAQAPRRRP